MAETTGVHAVVGLTGLKVQSGGITVQFDQVLRLPMPATLDLAAARRDFELLAQMAGEYPEDVRRLHAAAVRSDMATATRIAREIGLTEERFVGDGGGIWGAMITIAAVGLALAAIDAALPPDHAPGPEDPPPERTPIPDGGLPPGGAP